MDHQDKYDDEMKEKDSTINYNQMTDNSISDDNKNNNKEIRIFSNVELNNNNYYNNNYENNNNKNNFNLDKNLNKNNDFKADINDNNNYNINNINTENSQLNNNKAHHRQSNEEKIFFFKFLNNSTKIELNYDSFTSTVYWTSILEAILFIISLCFLIFHHYVVFFLIVHLSRAVIGLLIVGKMPKTYQIIENISGFENENLDNISRKFNEEFKKILSTVEDKLKILLVFYFSNTITCLIIDIVGIILAIVKVNGKNDPEELFFILIVLVVLFSLTFNYFSWMNSLDFSFSKETREPIKKMVIGAFKDANEKLIITSKDLVAKVKTKYNDFKNKRSSNQNDVNNNANNNL